MAGFPAIGIGGYPLINDTGTPAICTPEGCCGRQQAIEVCSDVSECSLEMHVTYSGGYCDSCGSTGDGVYILNAYSFRENPLWCEWRLVGPPTCCRNPTEGPFEEWLMGVQVIQIVPTTDTARIVATLATGHPFLTIPGAPPEAQCGMTSTTWENLDGDGNPVGVNYSDIFGSHVLSVRDDWSADDGCIGNPGPSAIVTLTSSV